MVASRERGLHRRPREVVGRSRRRTRRVAGRRRGHCQRGSGRPLRSPGGRIVRDRTGARHLGALRRADRVHPQTAAPVLALDIPSGLHADSGRVLGRAVRADHTVTFIALKPGLLTLDGPDHCGELHVRDLGLARRSAGSRAGRVTTLPILTQRCRGAAEQPQGHVRQRRHRRRCHRHDRRGVAGRPRRAQARRRTRLRRLARRGCTAPGSAAAGADAAHCRRKCWPWTS